ncbi:MAG: hypothetical protein CO064_12195 [Anaerolineae bacterium CG_4_9_14_0_8_um_filter_58_9]|nr:MAG: hypothetical protein CO064_12195 [Anaerolineae bacterium CG_4_9_14_0_8_um_filter_58_9]
MTTICQTSISVNRSQRTRGPGQPSKHTFDRIRSINQALVKAALAQQAIPADRDLAERLGVSERTVRDIRLLVLGLNRWALREWQRPQPSAPPERELICTTPFAGLWLLASQLIDSGLTRAAERLQIGLRTRVQPLQVVLTLVAWAALGFQRLFHVDEFRHWADMGLALFTGSLRLWSDTSLWRWVHGLTSESAAEFYQTTASQVAGRPGSQGRFSLDEHVVPSFSKLKPRRLGKTRVPTRGRSYPAFRLYVPFDLDLGRFVGVIVRKAREALSQTVLSLVLEVRRLRRRAGIPNPDQVRLIIDRGAYKGSVFETLMDDPQVSFIAMARATANNVRQWEALPECLFRPYQTQGDDNPRLKMARTHTTIRDCKYPLPSVVIRDDTPGTKQHWRVLFFKNPPGRRPQAETIDAEYRQRQEHELGFSQYVHALVGHSLPKAYQMFREPNADGERRKTVSTAETPLSQQAVQLVAWIKFLIFNLIKDFGAALGKEYAHLQVATLVRRYLLRPGRLYLEAGCLIVQLDPFRGAEALQPFIQKLNQRHLAIHWLCGLILQVEIAAQPQGLAAVPQVLGQKILANSYVASPT